jgi:hypothetical protein
MPVSTQGLKPARYKYSLLSILTQCFPEGLFAGMVSLFYVWRGSYGWQGKSSCIPVLFIPVSEYEIRLTADF